MSIVCCRVRWRLLRSRLYPEVRETPEFHHAARQRCWFVNRCPSHNCSDHGKCSHVDGTCSCSANWTGTICNQTQSSPPPASSTLPSPASSTLPSPSSFYKSQVILSPSSTLLREVGAQTLSSTLSEEPSRAVSSRALSSESLQDSHLPKAPNLHCENGALAIFVLCVFIIASVIVHLFICLKVRRSPAASSPASANLAPRKRQQRSYTALMQQDSTSSDWSTSWYHYLCYGHQLFFFFFHQHNKLIVV